MKRTIIIIIYAVVITMLLAANLAYSSQQTALTPQNLFRDFNQYRQTHGLSPVVWDDKLCHLATQRVIEIQSDWSHDGFYVPAWTLYRDYRRLGENLARRISSSKAVISAWDQSPEHHANLVANYTSVCFAVQGSFVTQELGTRF